MNITLSGSIVIQLNDQINFATRNTAQPVISEYTNGRYPDVTDELTIDITGASVSGVATNIKNLMRLQSEVDSWQEARTSPVVALYSGIDGNTYRTLVTNLSVKMPPNYYEYGTYRGVIGANVTLQRRGLWLTGSEGYNQTTSGYVNNVITITGMSQLPSFSPTDVRVSGLYSVVALPEAYLIVAGRSVSSTIPAIARFQVSGILAHPMFQGWTTRLDAPRSTPYHVAYPDAGWSDPECYFDHFGVLTSEMDLINSNTRTHVFGLLRNTSNSTWYGTWNARMSNYRPIFSINRSQYYTPISESRVICASGMVDPRVVYLGTITRNQSQLFTSLMLGLRSEPTLASGGIFLGDMFFVADTPETSIMHLNAVGDTDGSYKILTVNANYLAGDSLVAAHDFSPSAYETGLVRSQKPVPYEGNLPYTRSSVVDVAYLTAANGSWTYATTASGAMYEVRIGISRMKGTNLLGVS